MTREVGAVSYRFGRFVLDPHERRLDDGSRDVHLRPKTLDTLIRLVEHQGHLVTKQDLLNAVWADTAVTENALAQCIRELRDVLGDDQRSPRFIQTVQRAGYRFIADVERAPTDGDAEYEEEVTAVSVLVAEDDGLPDLAPGEAARVSPRRRRLATLGVTALALVAVAMAGLWLLRRDPGPSFHERDWILVADLENLTGEPAIDLAVKAELERALAVSRYANFTPPGRVTDTLRLMKKPPDTRVSEEIGREICLRDGGIRALLSGSVSAVGGSYSVALKLIDPGSGATVTSFAGAARSKDELLPAVHRLAADVRRRLGESLTAVAAPDTALEPVTTPSLEALTLYSRGLAVMDQFEWGRAEALFDQAVAQDPAFAAGYLFRGASRMMVRAGARADFEHAASLAVGVTPREHLLIRAMLAWATGDVQASADLFEALTAQYPDDYWGHEWASWVHLSVGDRERLESHQAVCRRVRPNFAQPHFHAAWIALLYDGDVERARHEYARVLELRPEFPAVSAQSSAGLDHWMRGRMEQAADEIAGFRTRRMAYLGASAQVSARPLLARFYSFVGRPGDALAMLETSRDMTIPLPDDELARRFRLPRALVHQALGNDAEFVRLMTERADASVGLQRVEALGWLGVAAARRGQRSRALALGQELEREAREPDFDFWHPRLPAQLALAKRAFRLQIDGDILLAEKRADAARQRFDQVRQLVPARNALFSTVLSPRVWLAAAQSSARAHEQLGDWRAAAADYQAILDHKTLCVGTDGAPEVWVAALKAISPVLERAGRPDEAARYLKEYRALRPN